MTHRQTLRWLAFDHHGVVTTEQAAAAGVPAVEVRKLERLYRAWQRANRRLAEQVRVLLTDLGQRGL